MDDLNCHTDARSFSGILIHGDRPSRLPPRRSATILCREKVAAILLLLVLREEITEWELADVVHPACGIDMTCIFFGGTRRRHWAELCRARQDQGYSIDAGARREVPLLRRSVSVYGRAVVITT